MSAPVKSTIDQRRGAPCCGGKLRMARFTHRRNDVDLYAGCECGYRVRIIRSAPRRF